MNILDHRPLTIIENFENQQEKTKLNQSATWRN